MGITQEREVARATWTDECLVEVWQGEETLLLSPEAAKEFAAEIVEAAEMAASARAEMDAVHASSGGFPYLQAGDGEVIL